MPRELIGADSLHRGVLYSYAAVARRAVADLVAALAAAGCGIDDVVNTVVYVASGEREQLVAAWQVVAETFGDAGPPSTLLGVAALGYPGRLVEIEAVAAPA
jgi:enamine deaminase RidA (YjgF/YER057c/UK114 family)